MKIYIDCEFDALRHQGKFMQCLVSIGAIACDEKGKPIGTFYSLMCPKNFRRLSSVVKRMTNLQTEKIKEAPSFPITINNFCRWLREVSQGTSYTLYSFGPDDKRTLIAHSNYEHYTNTEWMNIYDLQRELSSHIVYKNQIISPTLSLDDVKYAYDVAGDVNHNALNDAIDLMYCHQAMHQKICHPEHIKEIWERKEAKRLLTIQKEKERLYQKLNERYARHHEMQYCVPMYHSVVENLIELQERQANFALKFYEKEFLYNEKTYAYQESKVVLQWHVLDEEPWIYVEFQFGTQVISYKRILRYGNASLFDGISKVAKNYIPLTKYEDGM